MIQRHCRVTKRADGMSERYKPLSDAILDLLDQISAASAATGVVQEPLLADLESRWRAERPDDLAALTALLQDNRARLRETPEWETLNERTVEWNKKQTRHLRDRLGSV